MRDLAAHMATVARELLGEPNPHLSSATELRYGSRGSLSVDLKRGIWHDHEAGAGGGVLDLIARETGQANGAAIAWLRARGIDVGDDAGAGMGRRIVATYDYRDESGELLFQVCRFDPKDFRQRRPDSASRDGWAWGTKGCRRPLYRLPEILEAAEGAVVLVVEGEKDADRLAGHGLTATTNVGGAGKWRDEYADGLKHCRAVAISDNDEPGERHAAAVVASCRKRGIPAAVLRLEGLPPKGDVSDWLDRGGTTERLLALAEAALEAPQDEPAADAATTIAPTPYTWTTPEAIGTREWLFGRHLIRKFLSTTVAPGGLAKTSLLVAEALFMCAGRPLHGQEVARPLTVWLWNLEDPRDELTRRIQATALRYGITAADIGGRLYVDTGREQGLCTATQGRDGAMILAPVYASVQAAIRERGIDVLVIDPFVSSHRVSENDNGAIDAVAKEWGRLAEACNCAVELVHHARKLNGDATTAEHSRGAIALVAAARDCRVLNRMSPEEAEKAGVDQHRAFFRVQSDKANLAPPEAARWFHMEGVTLPNGGTGQGDSVGVPVPWSWPNAFDGVTTDDLLRVQRALDGKDARESVQSPEWAGLIVADVLGFDPDSKTDRERIKTLLKTWVANRALRVVNRPDKRRQMRPVLEVGDWAGADAAAP